MLSFPVTSVALPAATLTDTVPSEDPFTTSKVYVVPDPAKLLAAGELPFAVPVTVMSPTTKLDVNSLNVAVKLRVVSETVSPELPVDDVIVTVGAVVSPPIPNVDIKPSSPAPALANAIVSESTLTRELNEL